MSFGDMQLRELCPGLCYALHLCPRMPERLRICVLGAGVIGLHSAARLQRDFPAARVTILAAGQGKETTSIGAAGIFRPGSFNAATPQLTR